MQKINPKRHRIWLEKRVLQFPLFFIALFYSAILASEDDSKTYLLYIRHAEVPGNVTYTYTGSGTDESLTERGRMQAQKCVYRLIHLQETGVIGKVSAVYSSDLKRAVETAEPIAQAFGLSIHLKPNLREISWGCADGQSVQKMAEQYDQIEEQIEQRYPERKIRWDHLPVFEGAESFNALLRRTKHELECIAESHQGQTIVIIGHGRALKTLIADACDSSGCFGIIHLTNCSITAFTYAQEEGLRFIDIIEN